MLEAYLGRRSAARVQAGALRRGAGETIRAALLCTDLRDFTALSEASEPTAVIAALDASFDRIAGAVHAFGGEVLKFIGDGLLAIFPVDDARNEAAACEAALTAADEARAGVTALGGSIGIDGVESLRFGLGLHLGDVLYGNIGGGNRLDFTCIGPAVNLAARIEKLTSKLRRTVLTSSDFAGHCGSRLARVGQFLLPGATGEQSVFGLVEETPAAA